MKTEISAQVATMLIFDWVYQYCTDTNETVEREISKCLQGEEFNLAFSDLVVKYSEEQWWLDKRKG